METGPEVTIGPFWSTLVRLLAPSGEREGILQDLGEEAADIEAQEGRAAARGFIRWQVAASARPWVSRRFLEAAARTRRTLTMIHKGLGTDVRLALRRLAQSPGFTGLAVVTLAIGIGAVSTVFSLAYAMWLKPLPWHEPDRVVWLHAQHLPSGSTGSFTSMELAEHRRQPEAMSAVAGFHYGAGIARLDGEPIRISGHYVTPNLFRLLGVRPAVGRDFTEADAGTPVVILSHALWVRRFNRDPAITSRTLTMSETTYQIAGVMPPDFSFPRGLEADMWMPGDLMSADQGGQRLLQAVARLAPGRTIEQASAEVKGVAQRLAQAFPATNAEWTHVVAPAGVTASQGQRLAYQALLGIVGLFLLIACANLAGLLLARNAGRRVEFAVCLSLGAPRWRLVRALLIESLVLATVGGLAGILASLFGSQLLGSLLPGNTPGLENVSINVTVMLVTVGVSFVAAVLISVVPAISLRTLRPSQALAGVRGASRVSTRGQQAVVVVEVVLAVMLLAGATAMLQSFFTTLDRDRGYDPRGLQAINVSLPFSDDSYLDIGRRSDAFNRILSTVSSVPGVRSAAATTGFPGSRLGILGGSPITPGEGRTPVMVAIHAATHNYFDAMKVPLKMGRGLTPSDTSSGPKVVLVNEALAEQFPNRNPIGHRIPLSIFGTKADYEIVGVVGNIHLTGRAGNRAFVPLAQVSPYWIDLVFRADADAASGEVRRALRALNPNLLLENDSSFRTIIVNSIALERAQSAFAGVVGVLSTVVAGIGIYALLTFIIAQHRREFGIRLALGSQPGELFRGTLTRALRLSAIGLVLGIGAVLLLVRLIGSQVFGLTSAGLEAYGLAALVIGLVSVAAAWVPARRAMGTDPMVALRGE